MCKQMPCASLYSDLESPNQRSPLVRTFHAKPESGCLIRVETLNSSREKLVRTFFLPQLASINERGLWGIKTRRLCAAEKCNEF